MRNWKVGRMRALGERHGRREQGRRDEEEDAVRGKETRGKWREGEKKGKGRKEMRVRRWEERGRKVNGMGRGMMGMRGEGKRNEERMIPREKGVSGQGEG